MLITTKRSPGGWRQREQGGAHQTLVQDSVKRCGNISDVEITADSLAITVHGELIPALGKQCELGDELLGELAGPVHVVASGYDNRHFVRCEVCAGHHLCTCLGCRVWVGGLQHGCLVKALLLAQRGLTVHLQAHTLPNFPHERDRVANAEAADDRASSIAVSGVPLPDFSVQESLAGRGQESGSAPRRWKH